MKSKLNYNRVMEKYPVLGIAVRNSLMSYVTDSNFKRQERQEVIRAFGKLKGNKKRKEVIETFLKIRKETKSFTDIQPNTLKIFEALYNTYDKTY